MKQVPKTRDEQRITREEIITATKALLTKDGPFDRFEQARKRILDLIEEKFYDDPTIGELYEFDHGFSSEWELLDNRVNAALEQDQGPHAQEIFIAKMAACFHEPTQASKRLNATIKETALQAIDRDIVTLNDWTDSNQKSLEEHAESWNVDIQTCTKALEQMQSYAEKAKIYTRQAAEHRITSTMRALSAIAAERRPKSENGAVTNLLKAQVELVHAIPHRFIAERAALRNSGTMLNAYVRHHHPADIRMMRIVGAAPGLTAFLENEELVAFLKRNRTTNDALQHYSKNLGEVKDLIAMAKQYLEDYAPERLEELQRTRSIVRF